MLNVFKLNEQIKALEADKANLIKSLGDKETEVKDLRESMDKLMADKEEATKLTDSTVADTEAKVTAVKTEMQSTIDKLTAELTEAKASANKVAAQTVASLGIPEGTIKDVKTSKPLTREQAETEYRRLKASDPVKASQFYNDNFTAFLK